MNNVIVKLRYDKRSDNLVPATPEDKAKIALFKMRCDKDQVIESYMEVYDECSTRIQQNKLHKLIRELCLHTGFSFEEMKELVKKQAGLYIFVDSGIEFKSVADLSKSEMLFAIQTCINIGMKADCPMY